MIGRSFERIGASVSAAVGARPTTRGGEGRREWCALGPRDETERHQLSYETIIWEQAGAVGRLTLNRPETLNSFNWGPADKYVHATT